MADLGPNTGYDFTKTLTCAGLCSKVFAEEFIVY